MQPTDRSSFRPALGAARDDRLRSLAERAQALDALDRRLRQSLPHELAQRVRLANVRQGRLVFLVSAASLSTALRLHTPELLRAAREAGVEASTLTVKVATMQTVPPAETPRAPPLSSAAGRELRAAAASVADPDLRDQLLRMAILAEE
ncbi:DciA family protein [Pseudomarimonas salicorniae]|uniref:DciA family protein n=1 Tax=Pseudomarimonas salicorniae TaxID=2933270 RepID=A0ABT0GIV1_9GAMM|nr:DciA family protein [Lysobacter sp. CAU 1642]